MISCNGRRHRLQTARNSTFPEAADHPVVAVGFLAMSAALEGSPLRGLCQRLVALAVALGPLLCDACGALCDDDAIWVTGDEYPTQAELDRELDLCRGRNWQMPSSLWSSGFFQSVMQKFLKGVKGYTIWSVPALSVVTADDLTYHDTFPPLHTPATMRPYTSWWSGIAPLGTTCCVGHVDLNRGRVAVPNLKWLLDLTGRSWLHHVPLSSSSSISSPTMMIYGLIATIIPCWPQSGASNISVHVCEKQVRPDSVGMHSRISHMSVHAHDFEHSCQVLGNCGIPSAVSDWRLWPQTSCAIVSPASISWCWGQRTSTKRVCCAGNSKPFWFLLLSWQLAQQLAQQSPHVPGRAMANLQAGGCQTQPETEVSAGPWQGCPGAVHYNPAVEARIRAYLAICRLGKFQPSRWTPPTWGALEHRSRRAVTRASHFPFKLWWDINRELSRHPFHESSNCASGTASGPSSGVWASASSRMRSMASWSAPLTQTMTAQPSPSRTPPCVPHRTIHPKDPHLQLQGKDSHHVCLARRWTTSAQTNFIHIVNKVIFSTVSKLRWTDSFEAGLHSGNQTCHSKDGHSHNLTRAKRPRNAEISWTLPPNLRSTDVIQLRNGLAELPLIQLLGRWTTTAVVRYTQDSAMLRVPATLHSNTAVRHHHRWRRLGPSLLPLPYGHAAGDGSGQAGQQQPSTDLCFPAQSQNFTQGLPAWGGQWAIQVDERSAVGTTAVVRSCAIAARTKALADVRSVLTLRGIPAQTAVGRPPVHRAWKTHQRAVLTS